MTRGGMEILGNALRVTAKRRAWSPRHSSASNADEVVFRELGLAAAEIAELRDRSDLSDTRQ